MKFYRCCNSVIGGNVGYIFPERRYEETRSITSGLGMRLRMKPMPGITNVAFKGAWRLEYGTDRNRSCTNVVLQGVLI